MMKYRKTLEVNMKRTTRLLALVLTMVMAFTACGGNTNTPNTEGPTNSDRSRGRIRAARGSGASDPPFIPSISDICLMAPAPVT